MGARTGAGAGGVWAAASAAGAGGADWANAAIGMAESIVPS